jgi:hypothetical protein
MAKRGLTGDHQIKMLQQTHGIDDVGDVAGQIDSDRRQSHVVELRCFCADLQTVELNTRHPIQFHEHLKRYRAVLVDVIER